jgi:hypothetical protein
MQSLNIEIVQISSIEAKDNSEYTFFFTLRVFLAKYCELGCIEIKQNRDSTPLINIEILRL